jgi:hypothetical protein
MDMCNGDLKLYTAMYHWEPTKMKKKKQKLDNRAGKMAELQKENDADQQ